MVGGSGRKLLEISAAEADIANLAPPLTRGRLDSDTMVKFDKPRLRQKIALLHEYAQAAGRAPETIEISGFCSLTLAREKSDVDKAVNGTMQAMKFPSTDAVRNSPSLLFGTPQEVRREIRSRIEEFGMTYFIMAGAPSAIDLFVSDVMPEFVQH